MDQHKFLGAPKQGYLFGSFLFFGLLNTLFFDLVTPPKSLEEGIIHTNFISAGINLSASLTPVDCFGNSTGEIDLHVTGGMSPYSYDWGNNGAQDPDIDPQDLTGLAAGTFTVTVTDMTGCTASSSFNISQPAEIQLNTAVTGVNCKSENDGEIDLQVIGGSNLTYEYFEGNFTQLPNFDTLSAIEIGNISTFSISPAQTNNRFAFRFRGTIEIDSTTNYTFYTRSDDGSQLFINGALVVDNDGLHGAVEENGTIALTAGIHDIEVTFFERTGQQSLLVSYEASHITKTEIPASVLNGPYSFAWSNGAITEDVSDLDAGTYTVTVTAQTGCTAEISAMVNEPDTITVTSVIVNESCPNFDDGSIDLTVSGGVAPYNFDWSDDAFDGTENPTGLAPQDYSVTITDANNCQYLQTFNIGLTSDITATIARTDITCASTNNGSINVTVIGGNPPFNFDWNDNSLDGTEDPTELSAGTYTVTITDFTSCTAELTATLLNPDPSISASLVAIDVSCMGESDGALDLTITGGNPPYYYDWDVDALDGEEDHTCQQIGTYSVTVTDINGCQSIASGTINDSGITCPVSNIALIDQRGPGFPYPQFDTLNICQLMGDTLNLLIDPDNYCLDNPTFTIDFPDGMFFDGYAVSNPAGYIVSNDGNLDSITFTLSNISEPIELHITANADCNIVPAIESLMPININYQLNFNNPTPDSILLTPAVEYNTHIFTPFLNMLYIGPPYPSLSGGQTLERYAVFSQNGINASLNEFDFIDVYNGETTVIGLFATNGIDTVPVPFTDTGDTIFSIISNNILMSLGYLNGDGTLGSFDEDEQITIVETVVASCQQNVSEFIGSWGCGGQTCQSQTLFTGYNIADASPGLSITSVETPNPPDVCSPTQHIDLTIFNDAGLTTVPGGDYAGDLFITIATGCSGTAFNNIQIDENSFEFNGSPITAVSLGDRIYGFPVDLLIANGANLGGLQNLDSETIANDLAADSSIVLGFDYALDCQVNPNCGGGSAFQCFGFDVRVDYQDHCGIDLFETDNFQDIVDQAAGAFAIGQPDIIGTGNVPYNLNFCYDYTYTGVDCPGANAYLLVTFTDTDNVPQTATIDGMPATLTYTGGANSFIVEGLSLAGNISECINIEMLYSGTLAACDAAPEDFNFEVIYDCPCCSPSSTVRECATYNTVIRAPGSCPCESLSASEMTVERTTFSWTDATMTTITSIAQGADSGRALTCDDTRWTIDIVASGSPSSTFNDFSIGIDVQQSFSPFEFLNGTFSINGIPSGCTLTAPYINTSAGYRMNFPVDLMSCATPLTDGDTLTLELDFNTLDIPEIAGEFTFLYLRSEIDSVNGAPYVPASGCNGNSAGSNYYVANPDIQTNFTTGTTLGCGTILVEGTVANNSNSGDDFPNEFRPYFGEVTDVRFTIPEGYYFVNGTAQIVTSGPNAMTVPLTEGADLTVTGNDVTFDFADSGIINDKDVAGQQISFSFEIDAKCDSPTADATFDANIHNELLYTQPFEPSCITPIQAVTGTSQVEYQDLDLILTSLTEVRNGDSRIVDWFFRLCNNSQGSYDFIYFGAENTSNQVSYLDVFEVTDSILNGGAVTLVNSIDVSDQYGGAVNGAWVNLYDGNPTPLSYAECRFYRLTATYASCAQDSLLVKVAGNCGDPLIDPISGYTGEFGVYNCLNIDTVYAYVEPQDPSLQINIIRQPQTLELCGVDTFEVELKNVGKGFLYDVIFDVTQPVTGIQFVPGSWQLEHPAGTGFVAIADPTFMSTGPNGDLYRYDLSAISATLNSEGLHGVTGNLDFGRATLKYAAMTTCDFAWGSIFRYEGIGTKPCGDPSDGSLQTSFPLQVGQDEPYSMLPAIDPNTARIPVCDEDDPHTITLNVLNNGPEPTGSVTDISDSIRVYLPNDVTYVTATSTVGEPTITINGAQQILVFSVPSGTPIGGTGRISFDIDAPETVGCTQDAMFMETFSAMTLNCADPPPSMSCTIIFPTSDLQPADVFFSKPELSSSATATAACSGVAGTEAVTATINVTNSGVPAAPSVTTIFEIYSDDGNGTYDMTEILVTSSTLLTPLPEGDTTFRIGFNAPAGLGCGYHVVTRLSNDCTCSGMNSVANIGTVPYQNAGTDLTICHFGASPIGCGDDLSGSGYSYLWTEPVPGALDDVTSPNPNILPNILANTATTNEPYPNNQTYTFTLETNRGGACTTTDNMTMTVFPFLNGQNTINICQEPAPNSATSQILNTAHIPTEASNFNWTEDASNPNLGVLDDPTGRTPTFSSNRAGIYIFNATYTDHNGCQGIYQSTVVLDSLPVIDAGPDAALCYPLGNDSYTLGASASIGTGTWLKITGPDPISFDDVNSATATVSGLQDGFCYEFEWRVINATCNIADTVQVCLLTRPNAGPDQEVCGTNTTMSANVPQIVGETNTWVQTSGPTTATIADTNSPTTTISNMQEEATYIFEWRISNGTCSLADEIIINTYRNPTINAGADQTLCDTDFTFLFGTTDIGTGVWATTSTTATVNPTTGQVNGMAIGECHDFTWTVTNGACMESDLVQVCITEATPMLISTACNQNGTSALATDDFHEVTVSATIGGASASSANLYEVLFNGMVLNPGGTPYGMQVILGQNMEFPADGTTIYTLSVRDFDLNTCEETFEIGPLDNCQICRQICLPIGVQIKRD